MSDKLLSVEEARLLASVFSEDIDTLDALISAIRREERERAVKTIREYRKLNSWRIEWDELFEKILEEK